MGSKTRSDPTRLWTAEPGTAGTQAPPAGFKRRFPAFVFDALLVAVATASFHWGWLIVAFALYHAISLTAFGATLGKALCGLRVVESLELKRLSFPRALLRSSLGYLASSFFLLGFVYVLRSSERRAWHDVLFGTQVVRESSGPLSLGERIDRWFDDLDAWRKKRLKWLDRFDRIKDFVLWLSGLVELLSRGANWLIARAPEGGASEMAPIGPAEEVPPPSAGPPAPGPVAAGGTVEPVAASGSAGSPMLVGSVVSGAILVLGGTFSWYVFTFNGCKSSSQPAIASIVSDSKLSEIEEKGFKVYRGMNPPDVSGTYRWNSMFWTYSQEGAGWLGRRVCGGKTTFSAAEDGTYSARKTYLDCTGGGSNQGLRISGEGACFTLYWRASEMFEGCDYSFVAMTSGCVSDRGITDWQDAWFTTEFISGPCQSLMQQRRMPPIGSITMDSERDGIVERVAESG